MKYLFRKMMRDIWKMRSQFFAVFVMAMLSLVVYSGMEGVWFGLSNTVESFYNTTSLADAWIYCSSVSNEQSKQVEELFEVDSLTKAMQLDAVHSHNGDNSYIVLTALENDTLFKPYIIEGKEFDIANEGGIWISYDYAKENQIKIGDNYSFSVNGFESSLLVCGLFMHSEYIYYTGSSSNTIPDNKTYGYAVITKPTAEKILPVYMTNVMRISVTPNTDMGDLQDKIEIVLADSYASFIERDNLLTASQVTKEIHQMQNMSWLFSIIFVLLVVLCVYTTMYRIVSIQTSEIGTLKAVGISDITVILHYIFYSFFVTLAGCLCGVFLGLTIVSQAVIKIKQLTLSLPAWEIMLSPITWLICAGIVMISVVSTIVATYSRLNRMPAETLRGERISVSNIAKLKSRDTCILPWEMKWVFRSISRNKFRWIIGVVGIAGSLMLVMAGLGFKDSINYSNDYVFNKQFSYKSKLLLYNFDETDAKNVEELCGDDRQYIYENNAELYSKSNEKNIGVIYVIGKGNYINLFDLTENGYSVPPDRIAVNRKMADRLQVHKGDTVQFRIFGKKDFYKFIVDEIVTSPTPQGIFMDANTYEKNIGNFAPTSVLVGCNADLDTLKTLNCVQKVINRDDQLVDMEKLIKSVMTIVALLIVGSMFLSVTILYNIATLSFLEHRKEYALMRAVGFFDKEIGKVIYFENLFTSIIGVLLGIPLGYCFLNLYLGIVQFRSFEWITILNSISLIESLVLILVITLLISFFLKNCISRINNVEVLKSYE